MGDGGIAGACGIFCGGCEFFGERCTGCGYVEGKPFWTVEYGVEVCPLYACCVGEKRLEHCGLCSELPCDTFNDFHDPSLSPEEAAKSVVERISALKKRKEIGTEEWLAWIASSS